MDKVRILMVDDNEEICKETKEIFHGSTIEQYQIDFEYIVGFELAIEKLTNTDFDILILDLFEGPPTEDNKNRPGEEVLDTIRKTCFIPIIFYSGLIQIMEPFKSGIIRTVRKSDGSQALTLEIQELINSRIPLVKSKLDRYIRESTRAFFWDFVQPEWKNINKIKDQVSLDYLLIRKLVNSLSKTNIELLTGVEPKPNKIHPIEFYVFPPDSENKEMGDIIQKDNTLFTVLTPSCDFILREKICKAEHIILAKTIKIKELPIYDEYINKKSNDAKNKLIGLMRGSTPRYFFLPQTPFIENLLIDFQQILAVPYSELDNYKKVAKLDSPFSQSMLSGFTRYYNRIGHEDLDLEKILLEIKDD